MGCKENGMTEFVFARHAEKVAGENYEDEAPGYPMITRQGEAKTREKAKMLIRVVDDLPAGGVLVLGGVSKAARTLSTLLIFADELRKLLVDNDIVFCEKLAERDNMLLKLAQFCNLEGNRGAKLVIEFPFQITELAAVPDQNAWQIAQGILTGLEREEKFFRIYLPKRPITFFHVGHSAEIGALAEFFSKKGAEKYNARARYSFI